MRLVAGPEDVPKRDFIVGLVVVALLVAIAIAWLVVMISHAPGAKAV